MSLHDEAAPFLRPLLRNGRLAKSLSEVVEMLRYTLPMALELEKLAQQYSDGDNESGGSRFKVDVFPKACGWYRVLLGDLRCVGLHQTKTRLDIELGFGRHALDFRLMAGKTVIIVDGSHSLFGLAARDTLDGQHRTDSEANGANGAIGVLQAIPDFRKLIKDVVQDRTLDCWNVHTSSVALIDVGLVCHASIAGKVGLAVFRRVMDRLGSGGVSG